MAKQKLNLLYRRARIAAATQVGLIVFGWGVAQFPYLAEPYDRGKFCAHQHHCGY